MLNPRNQTTPCIRAADLPLLERGNMPKCVPSAD